MEGRGIRATRRAVVGVLVASIAAACGTNASKHHLSADDLRRIAAVAPMTPKWDWPAKATREHAGDCAGWRWEDKDKLGVTFACAFDSASAAHRGLSRLRAFARLSIKRTVGGALFTDVRLQSLGDEAWRIQGNFASGQEVTYGWRRGNLMLQVHIQCIFQTCRSDIRRAGRAWADAIDAEAVAGLR